MDIKQLIFFKRTAELEHMSNAAAELMVSEPFLSRSIRELEKEIGAELFDRSGRRIVLNQCGRAYYRHIQNIFNEIGDAKKEVQDIKKSQNKKLIIVTNVSSYMTTPLKSLGESDHDLKIKQLSARRQDIISMLQNGDADFGICCPSLEEITELETIHLRYEPGAVIFPDDHWLASYDEVSLDMIKNESFINVPQGYGTRDVFDSISREHGITPNIAIETADISLVFRYVRAGIGIAIVPLSQALRNEPSFSNNYTLFTENKYGKEIGLSWRKGKYLTEAGRMFIENVKAYYAFLDDLVLKTRVK
jgi:Transcriptional regulator